MILTEFCICEYPLVSAADLEGHPYCITCEKPLEVEEE